MSLRELWAELIVARRVAKTAHERQLVLAWHIEALHRQKKLPDLAVLLGAASRRQSAQEQKAMVLMLSEQYGFPVRTRARG